jgi:hypothetical protein
VSVGVLQSADLVKTAVRLAQTEQVQALREPSGWNPENFAREQIRGLVRQVFFSSVVTPVRQVVFCAADSETDMGSICLRVAESLALDTSGSVAMVRCDRAVHSPDREEPVGNVANADEDATPMRQGAIRIQKNFWVVPQISLMQGSGVRGTPARLGELRREFEYSIVQGPPAGESSDAVALGQSADGIVFVLAAHLTRRATALKIKATLEAAQVRVLGTVLSERKFPIPQSIYRRL